METTMRIIICVIILGFCPLILSSPTASDESQKLPVEHRGGPMPPPHPFVGPGPGPGGPFLPPPEVGPPPPPLPSNNNEIWPLNRADMPQIKNLNVLCEKNNMKVAIEFDRPFFGMIFSKGHYSDPSCVYLKPGSGFTNSNFDVFLNNCGTGSSTTGLTTFNQNPGNAFIENTIIIQYDPLVQEVWDQARKLRCTWYDYYEKTVTFKPFNVDTLQVVQANFLGDNVQCWMQIQAGRGPWANEVDGIVKIGQTMTMVLAIKDDENKFDMLVRNCVAHDGNRPPIQLVDDFGCVVRPKVMSPFQKIRNFGASASVVSYAYFQAFKFPDSMNVFFQCIIQVCRHQCPQPTCGGEGPGLLRGPEIDPVDPRVVGASTTVNEVVQGPPNRQQPHLALPLSMNRPVRLQGQSPSLLPPQQAGYQSVGRDGNTANVTKLTVNSMNGRPRAANLNKSKAMRHRRGVQPPAQSELSVSTNTKMIQVVAPGDVAFNLGGSTSANETVVVSNYNYDYDGKSSVCLSMPSFVAGLVILLLIVTVACLVASFLFVRMRTYYNGQSKKDNCNNQPPRFDNLEMVKAGIKA
ncbi:hypothetical protein CHUAL_008413 [Chamberlinius hualienensis]